MHRDHKIGLALAVLLIGLAAALCFPRTRLLPTAELEPVAVSAGTRESAPAAEITGSTLRRDSLAESKPVPVRPVPSEDPFAEPSLPEGVADVVVATPAQVEPQHVPAHEPAPAKPEPVVYTIQIGDTLSGLASRFLGSSARYQELFDANRDVLSSPDRLEPGVQIKIPSEAARQAESPPSRNTTEPAVSTTRAGFQPPSRTPFDVRRR